MQVVMDIVLLSGGQGQWDLVARLADHDHPGRELVEHLVEDDVFLELIEEEVAHVNFDVICFEN